MEDTLVVAKASEAGVCWSLGVTVPEFDPLSFRGKHKGTNSRGVDKGREQVGEPLLQGSGF